MPQRVLLTQAADTLRLQVDLGKADNTVNIENNNALSKAPHRLLVVGASSVWGQALSCWERRWNAKQWWHHVRSQPATLRGWLAAWDGTVPEPMACDPAGRSELHPQHAALGNALYADWLQREYAVAAIENRRVDSFVFCFWRGTTDPAEYYVQWELVSLLAQLLQLLRDGGY